MRVFVTGAAGFIGQAVVRDLDAAGHSVLGLARSDANADILTTLGAAVHRGDLADPASLAAGARACDGVIHLAFNHDWVGSTREQAAELDLQAVTAMLGALEGTDKPFVGTSGTMLLAFTFGPGHRGTEREAGTPGLPRIVAEEAVVAAGGRGVRGSVVRLSPTVHGAGDRGFVPMLIGLAREKGVSAYVGDGGNRWPAVHRGDAARLYRLALEAAAPGTLLHGAAEEGIPMRAIAEAIGAGIGVPTRGLTPDEAAAHFTWLAAFVGTDNPTSSALTREWLGWDPQGPDLLTDLRENGYFD